MKYRKKPVVIEAVQFDGTNKAEIQALVGEADWNTYFSVRSTDFVPVLSIRTLEGTMTVSKDDWVIKGVKGEFYPCKPDIFDATYEPTNEGVSA